MRSLCLFFLIVPFFGSSQSFNAATKTFGIAKTTDGKYEGRIDVNPNLDQVLWSSDNKTKIFGANQIKEVTIHLKDDQDPITYIGLKYGEDYYLFEILSSGEKVILYKEGVRRDNFTTTTLPSFFKFEKGKEIVPLTREKELLDVFGNDSKWMKLHIENNNLSLSSKADVRTAFQYYNRQFEVINPMP